MKKNIWKWFLCFCLMGILLFSGCGKDEPVQETAAEQQTEIIETTEETEQKGEVDIYQTEPTPADKPQPVEPQKAEVEDTELHCTISISCGTLLENADLLDGEKVELIPSDGWVLKSVEVVFHEGENVFQVLQRVCKQQKIHLEFMDVPIYNSAYIEGIHNLYEFDAGDLSGWMYQVNGWFPNYGCSRYQLTDGDNIAWVYTCDLGNDVGGGYSPRNGATE